MARIVMDLINSKVDIQKAFQTNKDTWNRKVTHHKDSDFYNIEAFKKGESSLNKYELEALGNVEGKSLLHLQCHFGQDTLSWNRMGAQCTGVDFSENAVSLAKELNDELKLNTKFVCCNVLDTSEYVEEKFDIVFTSYGTIGWLPDLKPWAKMIADRLKPGGFFYIADFHPIAWMFDYRVSPPKFQYGYQQKEAIYEEYEGTYANSEAGVMSKEFGWNHGLGTILNALIDAGLRIDYLKEEDGSPYDIFPDLILAKDGMYQTRDNLYPLVYQIKASKPS